MSDACIEVRVAKVGGQPADREPQTVGEAAAALHSVNWQLWQAEDRARADDYANAREEKRLIDRLNMRRNEMIQRIDELLAEALRG